MQISRQTAAETCKIGIDLGGTKTEVIVLASEDAVLFRKRVATPSRDGYDAIIHCISCLIDEAREHITPGSGHTIGIGIPGSISAATGAVQNANTTCLIGRPLHTDIERELGCSVVVENDANCFTLAECRAGASAGYGLVFGIIMGTGCGGGICIDGHVLPGLNRISGEWGHFAVDPRGVQCYCGNRGCVETKISGGGVESAFYARYGRIISMQSILQCYRSGDPECVETFNRFLDDFGCCLGGLISILDPDAVVLGGGLSNIDELYTLGLERVKKYVFCEHLKTPILKNKLGDSAGVFGAAWIGAEALGRSCTQPV
jgi:fructokinase